MWKKVGMKSYDYYVRGGKREELASIVFMPYHQSLTGE